MVGGYALFSLLCKNNLAKYRSGNIFTGCTFDNNEVPSLSGHHFQIFS